MPAFANPAQNGPMQTSPGDCAICGAALAECFRARLLHRHDVAYRQCPRCEFLCTEPPYWLDEAYSSAIASTDTGLVMRNLQIARRLTCVLAEFFDHQGRYLDTAGGTGLLTRMMRDTGFDFWWEDGYCANQMAVGFEARPDERGFEAVTAFEAVEHMPDPMGFVRAALERSRSRTLIFTTELFQPPQPPRDWWYYAQATGQHIAFFSRRTMAEIAARCGVHFHSDGYLHLFTAREISDWKYRRVLKKADQGLYPKWQARLAGRSLTQADHREMLRRLDAAAAPVTP